MLWQATNVGVYEPPGQERLQRLLEEGWEPFAVTGPETVWLRRQATGKPGYEPGFFPNA